MNTANEGTWPHFFIDWNWKTREVLEEQLLSLRRSTSTYRILVLFYNMTPFYKMILCDCFHHHDIYGTITLNYWNHWRMSSNKRIQKFHKKVSKDILSLPGCWSEIPKVYRSISLDQEEWGFQKDCPQDQKWWIVLLLLAWMTLLRSHWKAWRKLVRRTKRENY